MSSNKLARRYALALVSLGKESDALASISSSLHSFSDALQQEDRLLYRTLKNPAVSASEKIAIVKEVSKSLELHSYASNTILLLIERSRLAAYNHLVSSFDQMADELLNRVRATVTTASQINDAEKQELTSTLSKAHDIPSENLIVEFKINSEIIGGLIAKVGDRTYDGSIRSQLKELQQILK